MTRRGSASSERRGPAAFWRLRASLDGASLRELRDGGIGADPRGEGEGVGQHGGRRNFHTVDMPAWGVSGAVGVQFETRECSDVDPRDRDGVRGVALESAVQIGVHAASHRSFRAVEYEGDIGVGASMSYVTCNDAQGVSRFAEFTFRCRPAGDPVAEARCNIEAGS